MYIFLRNDVLNFTFIILIFIFKSHIIYHYLDNKLYFDNKKRRFRHPLKTSIYILQNKYVVSLYLYKKLNLFTIHSSTIDGVNDIGIYSK